MRESIDRFFSITASGSTVGREVVGGITTFATMSYIVFVQPTVLQAAGMPFGSVLLATCLSAAVASIFMGLLARYPFALAPGMGENFLFAFTICGTAATGGMGFSYGAGLAIVLISGLIFLLLSLVGLREKLLTVLPDSLRHAIGPGIGLFIAFIGLQWGGIIVHNPATMVSLGSLHKGPPLLTLFGVLLIAGLQVRRIPGAILIGILATAGMGVWTGVLPANTPRPELHTLQTFFHLDFGALLSHWQNALVAVALLFFLDLFDTVGTLVGVGEQAGFMAPDGSLPRAGRAFVADAAATCTGALLGTSTVTTYIESAAGVAAGARTGLAAVVTGLCFLFMIPFAPLARIIGTNIGPAFYGEHSGVFVSMYPGVAPALIIVGVMMMGPLRKIRWDDLSEALPAFFTFAVMVFGYGITEGIAMGCISFVLINLLAGKGRKIHPLLYLAAFALFTRYLFLLS